MVSAFPGGDGLPLPPFPPANRAALASLLDGAAEPLEAVLDLLLEALGARFVVCVDASSPAGARAVGRRPPGRSIPKAERLLPRELTEQVLKQRRPVLKEESPPRRTWFVGCPLADGGGFRVLFAGGRLPPPPEARPETDWLERWVPWISLAGRLADLRREHRTLVERIEAGGPPNAPGRRAAGRRRSGEHGSARPISPETEFPEIVTTAPIMRQVLSTIALVAPSDAAVLIEGESGTGKELIARAIHRKSPRGAEAFVSENCAACPEGLLESEFFGVERGAFTGAHRTKAGLFERAHGGTLFLDEIGEMDLSLQKKLLRALESREVRRVGGHDAISVDFRLICATNRVLAEETRAGRFRSDLFYRIEVLTIRLPPLRERREDIPPLVTHFLARHAQAAGTVPPPVDPSALRFLCDYPWPGNVRELSNEMSRAVALRVSTVTPEALSAKILRVSRERMALGHDGLRSGRPLLEIERDLLGALIRDVLRRTGGNKFRAAEILGISKSSLYRRLRRYSIDESAAHGGANGGAEENGSGGPPRGT